MGLDLSALHAEPARERNAQSLDFEQNHDVKLNKHVVANYKRDEPIGWSMEALVLAFEIWKNGKKIAVAGLRHSGAVSFMLTWVGKGAEASTKAIEGVEIDGLRSARRRH